MNIKSDHYVHTAYDPPICKGLFCNPEEEQTQQHFEAECNIDNIMAKYRQTGMLGDPLKQPQKQPQFGDYSMLPTFQEAQDQILEAEGYWMALPLNLRKKFQNPQGFLDFVDDSKNIDECVKLGIFKKKKPVESSAVPPPNNPPEHTAKPGEKKPRTIKKTVTVEQLENEDLLV